MKNRNKKSLSLYFYLIAGLLCSLFIFLIPNDMDLSEKQNVIHASGEVVPFSKEKNTTTEKLSPLYREEIKVIPGGQSIGVQLQTAGVLVVGHHYIKNNTGKKSSAGHTDVIVGDVIIEINKNKIQSTADIKPYVDEAGENNSPLHLTIKRGNKTIRTTLTPMLDPSDDEYKIGLYIRDSAAGIGTMTFHDPDTKRYGALGHVISDINTKKPIEMLNGTIVGSSVTSIQKGNNGSPGEKQARFSMEQNKLGSIIKNTAFGIFGVLDERITNGKYDKPLEITQAHEVEEGPAKILTVVNQEEVKEFDVEIKSSIPQKQPDIKGMVIKVTDENLLEQTGGIVQGMSGSPIIQNGKLVGAVTHVFVNDPTSGYGIHIEWMLQDAEINLQQVMKQAQ